MSRRRRHNHSPLYLKKTQFRTEAHYQRFGPVFFSMEKQQLDNCQQPGGAKKALEAVKQWLSRLSFRTGVIVLSLCVPCYIFSFAQMALPISAKAKGILWVVFFGLAKTFQYGGLTILGVEGWKRLKARFKRQ